MIGAMKDLQARHLTALLCLLLLAGTAMAHGVAESDQEYLRQTSGPQIGPFLYLAPSTWSRATITCYSFQESSSSSTGCGR
jgi:hypothetical protein